MKQLTIIASVVGLILTCLLILSFLPKPAVFLDEGTFCPKDLYFDLTEIADISFSVGNIRGTGDITIFVSSKDVQIKEEGKFLDFKNKTSRTWSIQKDESAKFNFFLKRSKDYLKNFNICVQVGRLNFLEKYNCEYEHDRYSERKYVLINESVGKC